MSHSRVVFFALAVLSGSVLASRGVDLVGYWQNWEDVSWWQNEVPGNCLAGCAIPSALMTKVQPYSTLNYGFTFLDPNPNPEAISCTDPQHPADCKIWDGSTIYIAANMPLLTTSTTISSLTPGLIAIGEVCRLIRQRPNAAGTGNDPRRCSITLGGWSDWAAIDTVDKAATLAKLVANMVLFTFADGVDIDMEHLFEFTNKTGHDEFANLVALIQGISKEFALLTPALWNRTAFQRVRDLQAAYAGLQPWEQKEAFYYPTNWAYLAQVAQNGPPKFSISYTTRFNAFLDPKDPWNYLLPTSPKPPPFDSDNEGRKIYPAAGSLLDVINIMAYDGGSPAGPLQFNFPQILTNFKNAGVDPTIINMGFEPGNQYAGGVWEGIDSDLKTGRYLKSNGYGGGMVWAINPGANVSPDSYKWAPLVAGNLTEILKPTWPYGQPPSYSTVDPSTGWAPSQ